MCVYVYVLCIVIVYTNHQPRPTLTPRSHLYRKLDAPAGGHLRLSSNDVVSRHTLLQSNKT